MNRANPNKYIVKMKFKGPAHFGNKEKTYNFTEQIAHSDTIFSGIINCMGLLYGKDEVDQVINEFIISQPPFKISSAFLHWRGEYFVPRPYSLNFTSIMDYKKAAKIKFLPLDFLMKLTEADFQLLNQDFHVSQEGVLYSKGRAESFLKNMERPRVTLDRYSSCSEIYYASNCYFKEDAGLWFFLDILDASLEGKIMASLKLLGDEGLGGERTYGMGLFEADIDKAPELKPLKADAYLLLSLLYPGRDEKVAEKAVSYGLTERAGYVYSPCGMSERKKKVRMFNEGSVFAVEPSGSVADVTPAGFGNHKVLRYGLAYSIPVFSGRKVDDPHEV